MKSRQIKEYDQKKKDTHTHTQTKNENDILEAFWDVSVELTFWVSVDFTSLETIVQFHAINECLKRRWKINRHVEINSSSKA